MRLPALILTVLAALPASAQLVVTHTGYLLTTGDAPLDTGAGTLPLSFSLYASSSGGLPAWTGACAVGVHAGYYAVRLGDGTCGTGLSGSVIPAGAPAWLAITVDGTLLSPRLALDTTANAANALALEGQSLANLDTRYAKLAAAATAVNQTLKWNGSAWQPSADDDSGGTVTGITAGTGLTGGTITTSGTVALADTSVAPGSYTLTSVTVDAQGRLTAAASGSVANTALTGPVVSALTATNGLAVSNPASGAGSASYTLTLADTTLTKSASGLAVNLARANTWTGAQTFTQDVDVQAKKIVNLGAPTATTDAATKAYVDATVTSGGIPSGLYGFFNAATCPSGWTAANGLNGTVDLRGEFIRGYDNGRGVDTGRTLGSFQADAFKNHSHALPLGGDGFVAGHMPQRTANHNDDGTTSTSPTGGTETRPRNVALLACMKI